MIATSTHGFRVLIAGGGIAGIEAALALRELAGGAVRVTVIDPGLRFRVPGTATGQAFGLAAGVDLRLADVVYRAGSELVGGRVDSVDADRAMVTLSGGRVLSYDALIVAVGATPVPVVEGALTFTGARDVVAVRELVDEVGMRTLRGAGTDVAFVVPPDCGWPLAAYELALMTREHLSPLGAPTEAGITIVTSEDAPLGVFGAHASAVVAATLARARITIHTGAHVRRWSAGRLALAEAPSVWADRVVALPVLRGPRVAGLPCDERGFIRVDAAGRVPGTTDVWAVGDGTTSVVKQGGVACSQADAAAMAIARRVGARAEGGRPAALAGWMWDGRRGRALPSGSPAPDIDRGELPPVWPVVKIGGRFLGPFIGSQLTAGNTGSGLVGMPG